MKRISVLLFLIVLVLLNSSSCKSYTTLEEYFNSKPDIVSSLKELDSAANLDIKVSDNEIICTYDLSSAEDITEEAAFHESTITRIEQVLENEAPIYRDFCSSLEEEVDIDSITITVKYLYGSQLITQRAFTSH